MADPASPGAPPEAADQKRRAEARRHNEHLKLAAAALDRISTVVLAGAVLAPIFQHAPPQWRATAGWVAVALALHAAAHYVISRVRQED